MQRKAMVIGIKPECIDDYKKITPIDFRIECELDKNQSTLIPFLTKKPDFVKNVRLSSNQIQVIILE